MPKTKVLKYLKVMISKFYPVGHIILIFIKRILLPLELFELCKGYVISQTNAHPQFVQSQHWIWWDSYFLK